MDATPMTWIIALVGLGLIGVLFVVQLVAVLRPRAAWTITNVYGGTPEATDPTAYFAFNQASAWADVFLWAPLQIAGSIGMLLGHRWGFLLALVASVPFWYTAVYFYIWDRDPPLPATDRQILGRDMGDVASFRCDRRSLLFRPHPRLGADDTSRACAAIARWSMADRGEYRVEVCRTVAKAQTPQRWNVTSVRTRT